jgi:hypothetical protein
VELRQDVVGPFVDLALLSTTSSCGCDGGSSALVLNGQISVPEAARKYGFTQGDFRQWADEYHRGGTDALKVNKKGLEAEYRAELKRLQAKRRCGLSLR